MQDFLCLISYNSRLLITVPGDFVILILPCSSFSFLPALWDSNKLSQTNTPLSFLNNVIPKAVFTFTPSHQVACTGIKIASWTGGLFKLCICRQSQKYLLKISNDNETNIASIKSRQFPQPKCKRVFQILISEFSPPKIC